MQNYGMGNTGFINPYLQRLNQLEQQFPQFVQQNMPMQNQNFELVAIPVTNIDEANAFRVDPNGTPTLFYNAGKNEVYLKKTNKQTGLADFQKFVLLDQPLNKEKTCSCSSNNYNENFKTINDKLDNLVSILEKKEEVQIKKEVKNAK